MDLMLDKFRLGWVLGWVWGFGLGLKFRVGFGVWDWVEFGVGLELGWLMFGLDWVWCLGLDWELNGFRFGTGFGPWGCRSVWGLGLGLG